MLVAACWPDSYTPALVATFCVIPARAAAWCVLARLALLGKRIFGFTGYLLSVPDGNGVGVDTIKKQH